MPKFFRTAAATGAFFIAFSATACGTNGVSDASSTEDPSPTPSSTIENSAASSSREPSSGSITSAPTPLAVNTGPGLAGGEDTTSSTLSDPAPSELPQPEAGEALTLSDFFQPNGNWSENTYSVADQENIKGIGSVVSSCYETSSSTELELRLQNKFDQLSFSAGQSNFSDLSDQRVIVRILGDNEQLDVKRVPFNEIQKFQVDVQDTNAVRLIFHLDQEVDRCEGNSVQFIVHDIFVE